MDDEPNPYYPSFQNTRYFGALDGLRALSILAVVWHHSAESLPYWPASDYGFLGVDLFFVISGFLIVTLLLRERDRRGKISLRNFYIRRTLRIFPLYYAVLFAMAVGYGLLHSHSEFGRRFVSELPIYLTYTGNLFPVSFFIAWSLAAEEQFYLLWPFVERNLTRFLVPLLVLGLAANQLLNFPGSRLTIAEWTGVSYLPELPIAQCTFTPILLGVALAHLLHDRRSFRIVASWLASPWAAVGALLALILICSFLPADISGFPRLLIQMTMTVLVAACVIREDHRLMPFLRLRPLVRLGVISYGIYLLHIHAIVVAEKLLAVSPIEHHLLLFATGLAFSVVAAELSFRLYESPFLRLKDRFSHQPNPRKQR